MLTTLITAYINFFFLKITTIISYLICFNKLKINIMLLCYVYLLILFKRFNKAYFILLLYYILTLNYNSIFFIKLFYYGFFKSHLLIFYTSVLLIKSLLYHNNLYVRVSNTVLMCVVLLGFILGGRWALYLYNWGYFWTNDSIEYMLVFFIYLVLYKIHQISQLLVFGLLKFNLILYTLVLLRLNLIYTKHNFFQQSKLSYTIIRYFIVIFWYQSIVLVNNTCVKFFKKLFNINALGLPTLVFLIIINKINYYSIQKTVYFLFKWLLIFYIISFKFINLNKILYLHWFFFSLLIYICYVYLTYFLNIILSVNTLLKSSTNTNYHVSWGSIRLQINEQSNNTTLKLENKFQDTPLIYSKLTKNFLNFLY